MASFNKVILMGNLVEDPERRSTTGGVTVVDMRLAINRHWTDRNGQPQKETCFVDVTAWDRLAETCVTYLKKGKPVLFEGYLKQETWEDKNNPGQMRSKIKVVAEGMQFVGPNENSGGGGRGSSDDSFSAPPPRAAASAPAARSAGSGSQGSSYRGSSNGPSSSGSSSSGGRSSSNYSRPAAPPTEDEEDIPF